MSPGPGRKRLSSSRLAILAEGAFGVETAKTASSAVRYQPERVSSVIDSRFAGRTVGETLGFGGDIPIVATFAEALATEPRPEALLVGIAPQGGQLPEAWRAVLVAALEEGLDVISGLHFFLCNDPELAALADRHGCTLFDLRKPPPDLPVGAGRAMGTDAFRVLTVGTDCNTGKMTVSLELQRALQARGVRAAFAATGQTGHPHRRHRHRRRRGGVGLHLRRCRTPHARGGPGRGTAKTARPSTSSSSRARGRSCTPATPASRTASSTARCRTP